MSQVKWPVIVGKNIEISYTTLNIKGNNYEFVILKSVGDNVTDVAEMGSKLKFMALNGPLGIYGTKDYTKILPPGGRVRSQLDMTSLAKDLRNAGYSLKAEMKELADCYIDVPEYVKLKTQQAQEVTNEVDVTPAASEQTDNVPAEMAEDVTSDELQKALTSIVSKTSKPSPYVQMRTVDRLDFKTNAIYYMDPAFYGLIRSSGVSPEAIPHLIQEALSAKFLLPKTKAEASHRLTGDKSPMLYYGNQVITATDFNELVERSTIENRPIFLTQAIDSSNYAYEAFAKAAPAINNLKPISFVFENENVGSAVKSLLDKSETVSQFNQSELELRKRLRLGLQQANGPDDIQVLKIPADVTTSVDFVRHVFKELGYDNEQIITSIRNIKLDAPYTIFTGEIETMDGARTYAGTSPSVRDLRLVGPDGVVTEKSAEVYLTSQGKQDRGANIRSPKTIEEVCAFFSLPVNAYASDAYYKLLVDFDNILKTVIVNDLVDGLPLELAAYENLTDNDISKIVRAFQTAESTYSSFSMSYFPQRDSHGLELGSASAFITAACMINKNVNNQVTNNPQALIIDKWIDKVVNLKSQTLSPIDLEDDDLGAGIPFAVRMYNEKDIMRLASDVDLVVEPLKGTEQGLIIYSLDVSSDGALSAKAEELMKTLMVQHEIKAAFLSGNTAKKDLIIYLRSKNYTNVLNNELSNTAELSSVSAVDAVVDTLTGLKLFNVDGPKEALKLNTFINKTEDVFPLDKEQFVRYIQDHFADDINNQVAYQPRSRLGKQVTSYMVPTNIAPAINEALDNLQNDVGDIGAYVMDQLGFTPEQMDAFDPGQIDTIGLLMRNHDQSMASIIGNSTGTGKTRVLVAMSLHAIRQGRTVDLVSKSRTLLESFVSEAHQLGVWDYFRPLVLSYSNQDTVINKPNGEEVNYLDHNGVVRGQKEQYQWFTKDMQKSRDNIQKFFANATDSQKPNIIMHTYTLGDRFPDPLPKDKNKRPLIKDSSTVDYSAYEQTLMRDKVRTHAELIYFLGRPLTTIADESHVQTGEMSNTLRNKERSIALLKSLNVDVVDIFASATWASKANKMGPYKNVFGDRVDPAVMIRMVQTIGLPAQESIVETVTRIGQYIRLELPKKGIVYDSRADFANESFYTDLNDRAAEVHLMMRQAKDVVALSLADYRADLLEKYRGRTLFYTDSDGNVVTEVIGGSSERISSGIAHLNFSSTATMFNRIFSIAQKLETGFIAKNIISEVEEGRAVLVSAELTGGTHVSRLIQKYALPVFSEQEIQDGAFDAWLRDRLASETSASEPSDMLLDLQFGCMPNTTSLLRRMFEESLAIDIVHEIQEPGKKNKTLRSIRLDYQDWLPVLVSEGKLSSTDAAKFSTYVDAIRQNILNLRPLPFSPYDQLSEQLQNLRIGEFSGRDLSLVKTPSGYYAPVKRIQLSHNQGKGAIDSFQNGALDCIIGSKSLFTGYNLNSTMDDPRPRTTINIEPIMAAIDNEQLKGRTNRIGVVGDVRMVGLSTTDIIDLIYTAKARKNGQSLNSLTGANAYSDIGDSSIELISTVGAKAIENVFSTSPELFQLLDVQFDQLTTEGRKAQTQEANVIMVLNQMIMLNTATKKQIVSQIENEYKQILNEMKMDGLDPFKDRVLNIDAVVQQETKIRDGVKGNPFKGDVYAIEMEGDALVGQSIKPSTILRNIASSIERLSDSLDTFGRSLVPHRDFNDVTPENIYLQFSLMYEDMITTIRAAEDSKGNHVNPLYARIAKRIDIIDSLSLFLKDARQGSVVVSSAGRGVLVSLNSGPQLSVNFNDGFTRIRNNDFADHLAWNMEVVFPGDKESRTMSFDSWLRQGISVTGEIYNKEHPLYREFKIASSEKHAYLKTKVIGLRGPMFTVTELAMDIAKVHGQHIIGEPVSVRLKDGSMERIWSMPKSVNFHDLITMPTRLANENESKLYAFVKDFLLNKSQIMTFASVVPTYERPISRSKDVYIELSNKVARLFVPGTRTITYGSGVIRELKLYEITAIKNLMVTPFSRTDKKSHSQFAEFDPHNIIPVIRMLDKLDIPLFMGRNETAIYRNGNYDNSYSMTSAQSTAIDALMSEIELIANTDNKIAKKKGAKNKQPMIEDADFIEVDEVIQDQVEQINTENIDPLTTDFGGADELMNFLNNVR
jgi:hypothetical protein